MHFLEAAILVAIMLKLLIGEVSKKKITIIYNIFFYDTSSASVIKEEGPV